MQFQFYKYDGEVYILHKPSGLLYFSLAIFGVLAIIGLLVVAAGSPYGIIWFLLFATFGGVAYYRTLYKTVAIHPMTRMILIRHGKTVKKQYPFSSFMKD